MPLDVFDAYLAAIPKLARWWAGTEESPRERAARMASQRPSAGRGTLPPWWIQ